MQPYNSTFGSPSPFGVFGGTTSGIFGANASSMQWNSNSGSPSVFGQIQNPNVNNYQSQPWGSMFSGTSTGIFGANSSSTSFGTSMPANGSSVFGQPNSVFGTSSFTPSTMSPFNSSGFGFNSSASSFLSTTTPSSSSGFGFSSSPSSSSSGFAFGTSASFSSTGFGPNSSPSNSSTGFAFGTSASFSSTGFGPISSPSSGFGFNSSASSFLSTTTPSSSSGFGFSSSPSNSSSGFAFGTSASFSSTGFGPNSSPSSGFGFNSSASSFLSTTTPSSSSGFGFNSSPSYSSTGFAFDSSASLSSTGFGPNSSPSSGFTFNTPNSGSSSNIFGNQTPRYQKTYDKDEDKWLTSISGLQVYKDQNSKSHEELRWENKVGSQIGTTAGNQKPFTPFSSSNNIFNTQNTSSQPNNASTLLPIFPQTTNHTPSSIFPPSNTFPVTTGNNMFNTQKTSAWPTSTQPNNSSTPLPIFPPTTNHTPSTIFQPSNTSPVIPNNNIFNTQKTSPWMTSPTNIFTTLGNATAPLSFIPQTNNPFIAATAPSTLPSITAPSNTSPSPYTQPPAITPWQIPQITTLPPSTTTTVGPTQTALPGAIAQESVTPIMTRLAHPFESEPARQPSYVSASPNPSIYHGISSMPIRERQQAPVRHSMSLLTARNLSQKRHRMPLHKYTPKIETQKVPFFIDDCQVTLFARANVKDFITPKKNSKESSQNVDSLRTE